MPRTLNNRRWNLGRLTRSPERFLFVCALGLCLSCALGGGGSRSDILSLIYVRIVAAWVFSFAVVLSWRRWKASPVRLPLLLIAALAVWMVLQLVPLPPALWQSMPGHGRYAALATILGDARPWRPVSLVPRLTWNSLVALGPPAALLMTLGVQSTRRVELTIAFWLTICLASALLGVLQVVVPDTNPLYLYDSSSRGYAVGLFANRNHHAAFLAAALPMLAIWASKRHRQMTPPMQAAAGLVAAALLIVTILATGSRAGLLLAGLGTLVAALILGFRLWFDIRRDRLLLMSAALLATLVVLVAILVLSGRVMAIARTVAPDDYGRDLRFVHAPLILSMVRMFFPFGTGFGSFDSVFRGFEPDATLRPTFFNHAHNDYLELALTGGLPSLLIAAAFVGWWARRSVAAWRMRSTVGIAGSTIILILLTASLVDYPLRTPLIAVFAAMACWWLAVAERDAERRVDDLGNSALRSLDRWLSRTARHDAATNDRAPT